MKLLLAHAYFLSEDHIEQKIMRPYPPLGLLYVSAYLEEKGISHEVFDGTFSSKAVLLQKVKPHSFDYLAFYVNFLTRVNVLSLIQEIRRWDEKVKFILGGPDVRYNVEEYLDGGADYLVIGEGEQSMYELLTALQNGADPKSIQGIAFLDNEGKPFITNERRHISDLDQLPWPNRKKIDLQKYLDTWKNAHGSNSITVNTQRGCPYTCNWCSHAVYGDSYRRRSPEAVVDELIFLNRTYAPDSFWFVDDVFSMSTKWLEDFKQELEERKLIISYECITRADRLSKDTIKLLKDTACSMIWIGAESGSQKIIDFMDRRVDVKVVRDMIRFAREQGIRTGTFIMLGYPGETMADIKETITHLKQANPDVFTINLAYPIKGTGLYDQVKDKIIGNVDWASTPDRDLDFKRTYKKGFYPWAIRLVYNSVYAHQFWMKKKYWKSARLKAKALISELILQVYRY